MTKTASILRLNANDTDFRTQLDALLSRETDTGHDVQSLVANILEDVKQRGDAALCEYTQRFDGWDCTAEKMVISRQDMANAWGRVSEEDRQALTLATDRIRAYHERQLQQDWEFTDAQGLTLGQRITPMDKVGLYVPGGKAAYPSSVLMNAVPAHVAGVETIVMVVPTPAGDINDLVLAAAHISGVQLGFAVGGAQAVAALAYGTATIPAVDKIVGPGNKFVAAAKRQVFGTCGIDMIAGPSEIAIITDGGHPSWLAADFLSQAEHDEAAQSILVSTSAKLLDEVAKHIESHLKNLPREPIARRSVETHGALILADSLKQAAEIINIVAPEHLELAVDDPDALLPDIKHAGAIFLGHFVPEALGDYVAGPNHVLPTNRTARFSSPLGVYDFQKRSSVIRSTREGVKNIGPAAAHLAHREGLQAHALTLELRLGDDA
ncbi:MAG: histidinol dehydrogenase [Zetaproteobacteria bacterium CG_4_9_14_3_um_filter_49_83]|nr:MAG: histidinol dehydrogenase [Zetaproteobacteria bacterium CG1_02_49_23]PIQ32636.1 MAG: histidinol dehydrogenase [Zetaproteobacteria bacterium CG17_big_fil_post_rev_8_21_14_2_50_50_13]PIV29646.1 MAG: histidinol dehydrogenase [Zetaproteobacteria bacterium CG02_land_8_20_14_3_00_50_9]PIY54700.1 MAG: histidinol dehydrogenase [Zetaproteobacteria bacterium CG_4_10_14_0_8_um_filter_49_80]PJA35891.1 MAG: histidinol dehydrogenase [Zetaproteobacteria bacterium CG_4_9_14_3_um_filter_49_83]